MSCTVVVTVRTPDVIGVALKRRIGSEATRNRRRQHGDGLGSGLADADVVLTAGTIYPAGGSTYENAGFIMVSDLYPPASPGVLGQGTNLAA